MDTILAPSLSHRDPLTQILDQYMQRCNPIGWLSRPEFEERWMQLLGVVNQSHPSSPGGEEGAEPSHEELHAHMLNVCAGVEVSVNFDLWACSR